MKLHELYHYKVQQDVELWEMSDDDWETEKRIGVFSSEEKALAAMEVMKAKEGYRDWQGGFRIMHSFLDQYETHGFISWDEAGKPAPPDADA
jgi:hypothetical protein